MKRHFPQLAVNSGGVGFTGKPPRICIVSYEFVGPFKNGGIGTAYTSMAEALAEAGFSVTCLYVGETPTTGPNLDHWEKSYYARGIKFVPLPKAHLEIAGGRQYFSQSYEVYQWFKRHEEFDVIHFPELLACGYHTLTAKRQGLMLGQTIICVGIHSMTLWLRTAMQDFLTDVSDLELDYMERQCVALANIVVSPSQYLLSWIVDQGWLLPEEACVQPYVQPKPARLSNPPPQCNKKISEFVFFGRLETRKGLALFCDGLDRLPAEAIGLVSTVSFLGRENVVDGIPAGVYIKERAKRWSFNIQVLSNYDQPEAIAYLKGENRLAVIPSLMENSPNTVYECLGSGIPFITSRAGGIPELIHPEDAHNICFDLRPDAIAEHMHKALSEGIVTSRPAIDATKNEEIWVNWHQQVTSKARKSVARNSPGSVPSVSVVIPSYNRPDFLAQALESIKAMDYPKLEVIIVDDGSFTSEAKAFLSSIESKMPTSGWKLIRQKNSFPGAARNAGSRVASSEYLFFMDDDDYADPSEIRTLVRVAVHTGAEIITCGAHIFDQNDAPNIRQNTKKAILPLGGSVSVGAFYNCFGDSNMLVSRSCFERLGGFTEDYGIAGEDSEFYARALLSGFRLMVVPELLYWRREHSYTLRSQLHAFPVSRRALRPYQVALAPEIRGIVNFANGLFIRDLVTNMGHPKLTEYEELTIAWRSKYEAGRILASANMRNQALQALLEAIKSVESSGNGLVIMEALLAVGEVIRLLDLNRAKAIARMASELAEKSPYEGHKKDAKKLLELVFSVKSANTLPIGSSN